MPIFAYKGLTTAGASCQGEIDAADRRAAVQKLASQGIRAVGLNLKDPAPEAALPQASAATEEDFFGENKPRRSWLRLSSKQGNPKMALGMLRQMLVLLSSGLPLGDTLRLLSVRLSDRDTRTLCQSLWKRLSEGSTLARALAEHPHLFADSTVHLIEAGEASGNLVAILDRLVAYMEEITELKKKIASSLAYPLFVCTVAIGVVGFFLFYLFPKIRTLIETLGGQVQIFAKILLALSAFLVQFGPFILIALVLLTLTLFSWRKTASGRAATDLWLLKMPVLGRIYLYSNIFQTSSLMNTLLGSGVNTTETLRLVEKTIANTHLRGKFAAARKQIQEGVSMATAIKRVRYMPDLAMDILTVGENTGSLVNSLRDINKIYRAELTQNLNRLTTIISTAALFFAFSLVALIALAIVLSVLQVSNAIRG